MGGWAQKPRCKAVVTNSSGIVASTCRPTTCLGRCSRREHVVGRVALRGQPQDSGAQGRVVRAAFVRFWRVFHAEGKIRPYSVLFHPTTSAVAAAKRPPRSFELHPSIRDWEGKDFLIFLKTLLWSYNYCHDSK